MLLQDHFCVSIRTSTFYTLLNLIQLTLTVAAIYMCFQSNLTIVSFLEIAIVFCLAFDLMVRNFSEKDFFKKRMNTYDLILLLAMISTMIVHQINPYFLEYSNNYLAIGLISLRYITQVIRVPLLLIKTRQNNIVMGVRQISFLQFQEHHKDGQDLVSMDEISIYKQQIL